MRAVKTVQASRRREREQASQRKWEESRGPHYSPSTVGATQVYQGLPFVYCMLEKADNTWVCAHLSSYGNTHTLMTAWSVCIHAWIQ